MHIIYLANARIPTPRAYGLQIMKTCEALAAVGTDIELVVPTRRVQLPEDPFDFYGIKEYFTLTTLPVPDLLHFGSIGFFVSAVWLSEKVRWLKSFWKADIVYSRDALVLVQYVLLGRKLVFEAHARPSFVSVFVARHAHRLIVISQGLKDAYVAAGVVPDKIVVAPDAVDEHLFDSIPDRRGAREVLGLPFGASIVLYAGHLYARKGADTLAAAAVQLPNTRFVFVGGTKEDTAAFKEKWGSVENIQIVGHVPHERIPFYLRAADVLVVPNSGNDEDAARFTSPMKLFEYMASGTPIVASRVPAICEVLDETTSTLVEPDSAQAFAQGIHHILSDGEAARACAERAEEKAQQYSWRNRAKKILAFL